MRLCVGYGHKGAGVNSPSLGDQDIWRYRSLDEMDWPGPVWSLVLWLKHKGCTILYIYTHDEMDWLGPVWSLVLWLKHKGCTILYI